MRLNGELSRIYNKDNMGLHYQWVAQREQYQDELARIWKIQSAFYPNVLTKDFYDKLSLLLFRQIPFPKARRYS